jgi:hypothetical protein
MIQHLYSGSSHINIQGGNTYTPSMSPGALSAGQLRYNPNMARIEVYDGLSWQIIGSTASIDLGHDAKQAIEWACKKMQEEKQLAELMARHPGLKELNDKFEMMKALCQEEEKHK